MMKKMRWSAAPALLCAMAVLLAGCDFFAPAQSAGQTTAAPGATTQQAAQTASATPSATPSPTATPKPAVDVAGMLPGDKPVGMDAVLQVLNARLEKEAGVKLQFIWTPADQYEKQVTAAADAKSLPDFFWFASSGLKDVASQGIAAPLDDLIAQYGADLIANIGQDRIDTMKVGGKLMGIPSAGNSPIAAAGHTVVYRSDLLSKYGLPAPDTIDKLEQDLAGLKAQDSTLAPIASEDAAFVILPAFGAEEVLDGTNQSIAYLFNADNTVTCLVIQDAASFKGAVASVRAWFKSGWLPKDVLGVTDTKAALTGGTAAMTDSTALSASSWSKDAAAGQAGATLGAAALAGTAKYITTDGGSALCLSATSANPDRVVGFWNWIYASQENYDLLCYGVEGTDYSLDGDRINALNDSYSAFPAWAFANANYMRFPAGVPEETVDALKHWNDGAQMSPLAGFAFDPTPVKAELAKVKTAMDQCLPLLNTGSADTAAVLTALTARLKAAGQDKVLAEAQKQVNAFLAAK